MSNVKGKVLKHGEQTRMMHWVHAIAFIILGLTGMAFYFDLNWLVNIFLGDLQMPRWYTVGQVWHLLLVPPYIYYSTLNVSPSLLIPYQP